MEITVRAIVLRRKDSGESDRRLTILSSELGKVDVVAKGARKAASRLAGSSDPLAVSMMTFAAGKRNRFVTQVQPLRSFPGLRTDYDRLTLAIALAELYSSVLPYDEPLPEMFAELERSLGHLERHPSPLAVQVWAESRLLDLAGFRPVFDRCAVTGESIAVENPFVSPTAGGFVSEEAALTFGDRYRVRAQILYGLDRIGELTDPPAQFRAAEESLGALFPFWRHVAEAQLPANESLIHGLRERLISISTVSQP